MQVQEIKTVFMYFVQNEVYCDIMDLEESIQKVAAASSSSEMCQLT